MIRKTAKVRPILVVTLAGDVEGYSATDIAIEGLAIELMHHMYRGTPPEFVSEIHQSFDLLDGVDTYDANVIRFLENLVNVIEVDASYALVHEGEEKTSG